MIETRVVMKGVILFYALSQLLSADERAPTALKFSRTGYIYKQLDMSPLTDALTICSWVKRMSNHKSIYQFWFNYVATTSTDEIAISDVPNAWLFKDQISYRGPTPTINEWHQTCITWGYSTKTKYLYYDGEQIGSEGTGERKLKIPGAIMLGQIHYENGGGEIVTSSHFGGELYDTNIWSFQMTSSQVKEMFTQGLCSDYSLSFKDTSFLSWEDILLMEREGEVTEKEVEDCRPGN